MMKISGRTAALALSVATVGLPLTSHADDEAALAQKGSYIAILGDCAACHTSPDGPPFSGGLGLNSPLGKIYATNITPDKKTGIGNWSFEDFERLMRHGIRKDGSTVYPAMPYPSYAHMSDNDLHALYAYLMHSVVPVEQINKVADIRWPFSIKWPLSIWRMVFVPKITPSSDNSSEIERGRYLVEGPGHCGSCHTPRNFAMAEKALDDSDQRYLSGGFVIDNWVAPSLRSDTLDGLEAWSAADIATFLKKGRDQHGATFGAMNGVVIHSTSQMTDDDLSAIGKYLKTLKTPTNAKNVSFTYNPTIAHELASGKLPTHGAALYVDRCAACHRPDGRGYPDVFPELAGNPVLQSANASSVAHLILNGGRLPALKTAPSSLVMGPYRDILDDQDIADLTNFVQSAWGNRGGKITADDVAKLRKETKWETLKGGSPETTPEITQ